MSRSIEAGADLAELGVEVEIERDNPSAIIEVLRTARRAERSVGPSPTHDEVLAGLLVELRQTMNDVRTVDQTSVDRVKLRRRQAELERRVRDRARLAPDEALRGRNDRVPDDTVGVTDVAGAADVTGTDDVDRVVVVSVHDDRLIEVATWSSHARIRTVPLDEPIDRLLESVEFALHRLNRQGISAASRSVAGAMLDDAGAALEAVLVPDEVRQSNRPVVVTPVDVLHGFAWRVLPSMRSRSITVSSSVGERAAARPAGRSLLIAGPDLAHSESEIERVAEVIGDAMVLDARSATVEAATAAMCEADLVHVACHGTFRSDNPLFSSLHLADGDLTIFELERCFSLPHTMVLSACNAGQSAVLRGGALLGFASALMQLGLANVVAPLTAVNDEHSVDVMVEFHRRLHQGDDPAGALAAVSVDADGGLDPTAAAFSCFGV